MSERVQNVLFLGTGNATRSIMAEAVLNDLGRGRFRGFSAGSHPAGAVHPLALDLLKRLKFPVAELRSKSWTEFVQPDAPVLDFVFTVCDQAAAEAWPAWPGRPLAAHWGFADPGAFQGSTAETAAIYAQTLREIQNRVQSFVSLPLASVTRLVLKGELDRIGTSHEA